MQYVIVETLTILRKERDKMVYDALFNDIGISGLKEAWLLFTWRLFGRKDVEVHKGLGIFFQDLNKDVPLVMFCKRHFPPVYDGRIPEAVLGTQTHLPSSFIDFI